MEKILLRTKEEIVKKCAKSDGVVHLRGLPFNCTKEEIASFFLGKFIRVFAYSVNASV
jgi:hypothetical protein